jgi:hypothetical protein
MKTTARGLAVKLALDPSPLASVVVPNGQPRVTLTIEAAGRTLHAELNAKSARRAVASINELGPAAVVCILQGKLTEGDVITEAGIAVQPKAPPEAQTVAA